LPFADLVNPLYEQEVRMTIDSDRSKDEGESRLRSTGEASVGNLTPPVLFTLRSLSGGVLKGRSTSELHMDLAEQRLSESKSTEKSTYFVAGLLRQSEKHSVSQCDDESDAEIQADLDEHVSSIGPLTDGMGTTPSLSEQVVPPALARQSGFSRRSWGERIGSHGLVIGLLLAVVAAALFTGKEGVRVNPNPDDLLSFDDESVNVALPEMLEIDLGQLEEPFAEEQEHFALTGSPSADSQSLLPMSSSLKQPFSEQSSDKLARDTDQAMSAMQASIEAMQDELSQDSSNSVLPEETQTVHSVSTNLDQLANRQPTGELDDSVSGESVRVPKRTATPGQISDWLKYLPPVDRIATESTNPSSSIQK